MTNPFALLGLPVSLELETAAIEEAWRQAIRQQESEGGEDASELHASRSQLVDPVSRLEAWLEVKDPGGELDRAIAPELMDLFAKMGPALASADQVLSRHRQASTALVRALLAKECISAQLAVQGLMQEVLALKSGLLTRFAAFEAASVQGSFAEARRALGQLRFLSRWEAQCRERLLALLET